MKTEEFVKRLKKLGYTVEVGEVETMVSSEIGYTVAVINEEYQNMVNLGCMGTLINDLFDAIVAYAKTPVEDRKEPEKKYFVKVLPGEYGYLYLKRTNSCEDSSKYYSTTAKLHNATNVKATFTKKEMADMRKESGLAIDWDNVGLEPEV